MNKPGEENMQKITDYLIVTATSVGELQLLVNENIVGFGWQPIGGVHSQFWHNPDDLGSNYYQSMVKYADE